MHERRQERQFGRSEAERLARGCLVDPVHFIKHLARHDFGDPVFRIALAVAHAHLGGFARDGLVRKYADKNAAAALDVSRHRAPRRLNLTRRQTPARHRFQTVFTETHLGAARRDTFVAALLFLAVLPSSWLQHALLLCVFSWARVWPRACRPRACRTPPIRVPRPARPTPARAWSGSRL